MFVSPLGKQTLLVLTADLEISRFGHLTSPSTFRALSMAIGGGDVAYFEGYTTEANLLPAPLYRTFRISARNTSL